MSEARTVSDPAGNAKLSKGSQGGRRLRARDDAAAAAILAVAAGVRQPVRPPRRWRYAGSGVSRHHVKLNPRRWAAARRTVLERDGYRCVECGRAGRFEADHITPLQRGPGQDPYDLNGLQTLCRSCHIKKTFIRKPKEADPGGSRLEGSGGGIVGLMIH